MSTDTLVNSLPDLVMFVRRDGVILRHAGGRTPAGPAAGLKDKRLEDVWGEDASQLLRQMLRRALTGRERVEGRFVDGLRRYEARVEPQGPDRVLCVIRPIGAPATPAAAEDAAPAPASRSAAAHDGVRIERRGFYQRLQESVADAALRERPLAVCLVLLQGLTDIGKLIDFSIGDQVATAATLRLREVAVPGRPLPPWYLGQLGEGLLAVVVEGEAEREQLRALGEALCDSLSEPVQVGDASFQLLPCVGIALLGQDASQPRELLQQARAALLEARRSPVPEVRFYSDTLRMQPLARLDFARDLRAALDADQLSLRYRARHDLASGQLVAVHAYLRWSHPVCGDIRPAQFLPVAETTGLAVPLSRWALGRLRRDLPMLQRQIGAGLRVSFGALRQHVASDQLAADVAELLRTGSFAADRLELRVSERTVAGLDVPDRTLGRLADLGASLVVDEVGRGVTSLSRLVHLPVEALQVDRSFPTTVAEDPAALRVCRAVAALAQAYGLKAIATGVDTDADRARLGELGFAEGLGDRWGQVEAAASAPPRRRARA